MVELIPTTAHHAALLAPVLRREDAAEVAAFGYSPFEALTTSWELSDFAVTVLVDGEVAAMAGLVLEPPPSALGRRVGVPWMLTSPAVHRHPRAFHAGAMLWLAACGALVDCLRNYVDARNTRAVRWLRALGFHLEPARPLPRAGGVPFHLFTMEA